MRLIDANDVKRRGDCYPQDIRKTIANILSHTKTVKDAVCVVRCKDCRWGREACGNIECFVDSNMPSEYHGYEWFCPNGERRNE